MDPDTETRIRERAYEIWVREGRPHGRHVAHWEQAKAEIAAEDAAGSAPPVATETPDTPEVAAAPAAPAPAPVRSRSVASRSRRGATATPAPAQEAETEDAAPPASSAPQARARKRGAE